jgi:hypothetical protein
MFDKSDSRARDVAFVPRARRHVDARDGERGRRRDDDDRDDAVGVVF